MKKRGFRSNPSNRFEKQHYEATAEEAWGQLHAEVPTEILSDPARQILAKNDSPDVGFRFGLNPYRGCEHACSYCFARPTHEYLGLSAGLDFESKIFAKFEAPKLLRQKLASRNWVPEPIAMSGVTDPYQPIERKLRLTRACLQVLCDFRNPVAILSKSALISRDIDLLQELAEVQAVSVMISLTTLDATLQQRMEPRAAHPAKRLATIETLRKAGIPIGVLVAPIIPGLTDHETPAILQAAADAGASHAGRVLLRLPHGLKELFTQWLQAHYPERKDKVLHQLQALRGGKLYDSHWGTRQRGSGKQAIHLSEVFHLYCKRTGLALQGPNLSSAAFRVPGTSDQLTLF